MKKTHEKPLEGVSSILRDSEITSAPSEDSADSVDGGSVLGGSTDGFGLLDEVKPAPDEAYGEPSDLVFDVSLDGVVQSPVVRTFAVETAVVETTEAVESTVELKDIIVGESDAALEIIQHASKIEVIPVSQAVYGTAKNVWTFGTRIPILNLWMGLTHHVAQKVAGVVGQELESVDNGIETKLAEFDHHVSRILGR